MVIDLAALAKFDTPTISNTIELFEVRPRTAGYMDGRVRACSGDGARLVGYAATAVVREHAGGDVYGSLDEQVARFGELAGRLSWSSGSGRSTGTATFGEIMHHLPGIRRGRTDHVGSGARSGPGAAAGISAASNG
jgi:hypothetical protein